MFWLCSYNFSKLQIIVHCNADKPLVLNLQQTIMFVCISLDYFSVLLIFLDKKIYIFLVNRKVFTRTTGLINWSNNKLNFFFIVVFKHENFLVATWFEKKVVFSKIFYASVFPTRLGVGRGIHTIMSYIARTYIMYMLCHQKQYAKFLN